MDTAQPPTDTPLTAPPGPSPSPAEARGQERHPVGPALSLGGALGAIVGSALPWFHVGLMDKVAIDGDDLAFTWDLPNTRFFLFPLVAVVALALVQLGRGPRRLVAVPMGAWRDAPASPRSRQARPR